MASNKTVKELSVKFEGDVTGLNKAIKSATASFNDIEKATQSVEKQFDKFGAGVSFKKQQEAFDLLNAKVKAGEKASSDLYDMMEQLKKQDTANLLTSQFQKLSEKYQEILAKTNEAKDKLESLNNIDFIKASTAFEKIKVAIEDANKKINDTTTYIGAVNKALEYSPDSVELLGIKTGLVQQQMATLRKESQMLGTQLNALKNAGVSELSQDFIQASNALNECKETYQRLKAETVEYQQAMQKASELANDMATRADVLRNALQIDPTNIKLTNQYVEVLRQELTKAKSEEEAFNKAIESLKTNKVAETSEQFIKLRTGLVNCKETQKELISQLNSMTTKTFEYAKSAESVKKSLSETSKTAKVLKEALDLDPTSVEEQKKYTSYLEKAIIQCQVAQNDLNEKIADLNARKIDETNKEYVDLKDTLNLVKKAQQDYQSELDGCNNKIEETAGNTYKYSDALMLIETELDNIVTSLGKVTMSLFDNAESYETNIASIRKVVTDLSDETISELKEIAIATGQTFDNIAEYATIGATLGIAQDALSEFTQAMVNLEVASDNSISGEEGASAVARLLNQFNIGAQYAENFGSAITYVADQFAATADETLTVATRMSGLSAINNVTIHDLIGLASEMKNLGIESESGASAVSKTFLMIENQVETAGDNLQTFASVSGMTAKEFQETWQDAPMNAFLSFVNGLSTKVFDEINQAVDEGSSSLSGYAEALGVTTKAFTSMWKQNPEGTFEKYKEALGNLEEGSVSASVLLNNLSLSGVRVAQTLLKLAGNGDTVRAAIADSNKAWEENTDLTRKAGEMYETTEYKLASAKEALSQAAATLGDTFLPLVKDVADIVTSLAKSFNSLPKSTKTAIASSIALSAGITKIGSVSVKTVNKLKRYAETEGVIGDISRALLTKIKGLSTTLGSSLPIALGVAGAALLAYAGYQTYTNRETVKFNNTVKELQETSSANLISALKNVNSEMVDVNSAYEKLNASASNLELNPNGTINTTSESYQQLQADISTLNSYMGGEFISGIDSVTGEFVNQKGEIVDVRKELENLRTEKERQAYLDANEDQYNEMLNQQSEYLGKITDKLSDIKKTREDIAGTSDTFAAFSEEDWDNFNAVQTGYKDISEFSGTAKDNIEQMQSLIAETPLLGEYEDLKDYAEILSQAQTFIDQYNQIDTAPIEEVSELIDSLTSDANEVVFTYNADSVESCRTALQDVNDKLESAQQLAAIGIDTTTLQKQYEEAKLKILEDLDAAILKQQELDTAVDTSSTNMQTKSHTTADEMIADIIRVNQQQYDDKSFTVTEYRDIIVRESVIQRTLTSGMPNGYNSGGFGNNYSVPNLTIPNLSTRGFGDMTLKASFTINNTGDNITQGVSQKIGKQIVNYINAELGRLM